MIPSTQGRAREGGFTLVVSALILVALMGLGLSAIWMSSMNLSTARNLSGRQAALNAAQAGIQHSRAILVAMGANPNDWTPALRGHSGQLLDEIPTTGSRDGKGALLYDGTQPLNELPFRVDPDTTKPPLGRYSVWIRNDPQEMLAGTSDNALITETNGVVLVRSRGMDPTGQFQVVLKAAIVQCAAPGGVIDPGTQSKNLHFNNDNHAVVGMELY